MSVENGCRGGEARLAYVCWRGVPRVLCVRGRQSGIAVSWSGAVGREGLSSGKPMEQRGRGVGQKVSREHAQEKGGEGAACGGQVQCTQACAKNRGAEYNTGGGR